MSWKKVIVLLLLICIALAISILFSINKRHTDWVVNAYTAALENAKVHFSDYNTTGTDASYTKGIAAFNDAVQIILTEGERLDIYKERQTLMASCSILSLHPSSIDDNIPMLLSALDRIINDPQKRVSYGELLEFYNVCNHSPKCSVAEIYGVGICPCLSHNIFDCIIMRYTYI